MAGRNLTFEEWEKLSEYERGEQYKNLSDHDKFRVRISMPPSAKIVHCNNCEHYLGFGKCSAFPKGISGKHIKAVEQDPSILCGDGLKFK